MHLLQSDEPIEGIALWLGHESPTTTHQYTEANLAMKEKALARMQAPDTASRRFRASDSLLECQEPPACEAIRALVFHGRVITEAFS